ncbi:MAG TPA: Dabb family protein [Chitinophagaceae bacterium]|nr:Dabb family protein [Chitinophagaceae bacterium]
MKKIFFLLVLSTFANLIITGNANAQADSAGGVLRHIVTISFKKEAPADSIQAIDKIYMDLSKSSFVKDFEMGTDISTRAPGVLRHVYMTTFASREDMQSYKKIPEYQMLFKISLAIADDVNAVDYWAKK